MHLASRDPVLVAAEKPPARLNAMQQRVPDRDQPGTTNADVRSNLGFANATYIDDRQLLAGIRYSF